MVGTPQCHGLTSTLVSTRVMDAHLAATISILQKTLILFASLINSDVVYFQSDARHTVHRSVIGCPPE